jgi:hypothetical protein
MSWEQDITEQLQEASNAVVRFDIQQEHNNTDKARARNNIGIGASATQISGDDYKIKI